MSMDSTIFGRSERLPWLRVYYEAWERSIKMIDGMFTYFVCCKIVTHDVITYMPEMSSINGEIVESLVIDRWSQESEDSCDTVSNATISSMNLVYYFEILSL